MNIPSLFVCAIKLKTWVCQLLSSPKIHINAQISCQFGIIQLHQFIHEVFQILFFSCNFCRGRHPQPPWHHWIILRSQWFERLCMLFVMLAVLSRYACMAAKTCCGDFPKLTKVISSCICLQIFGGVSKARCSWLMSLLVIRIFNHNFKFFFFKCGHPYHLLDFVATRVVANENSQNSTNRSVGSLVPMWPMHLDFFRHGCRLGSDALQ